MIRESSSEGSLSHSRGADAIALDATESRDRFSSFLRDKDMRDYASAYGSKRKDNASVPYRRYLDITRRLKYRPLKSGGER